MSRAIESVVPPALLDVGALERKLLELRAEINAILEQLACQKAPAAADTATVAAEAPAQESRAALVPAEAVLPEAAAHEDAQAELEPAAPGEDAAYGLEAPTQAGALSEPDSLEPSLDAALAVQQLALAPAAEHMNDQAETRGDALPLVASSNAELACGDQAGQAAADAGTTEEPHADAEPKSDLPVSTVAETTANAVTPHAPGGNAEIAAKEPLAVAAAVDIALEAAPAAAEAAAPVREAPAVISFEPRQRKERSNLATTRPAAALRNRRVASKVAAGIVALIAAASALMMADQGALGGSQSLPWVSPLPSYQIQMPWSLFGQQKRTDSAAETGIAAVGSAAANETLLARYREAWPVSP